VLLTFAAVASASTAANSVPTSRAGVSSVASTVAQLTPAACAGLNLSNLMWGSGNVNGTNGSDLILGAPGSNKLDGKKGNDCLVAGAGTDRLDGGQGYDICIGPRSARFQRCETTIKW
jgi:Ca2+-binding RTX toxin-like protein